MRTSIVACTLWMGACSAVNAQDWNTGGNFINGTTQYLGCDALSTQPLRFSTLGNYRHEWRTQNTLRMRLLETNITQTIGGYLNQTVSGNLGVGLFNTTNVTLPWSLLQLYIGGGKCTV